jgi:hypothetical protein
MNCINPVRARRSGRLTSATLVLLALGALPHSLLSSNGVAAQNPPSEKATPSPSVVRWSLAKLERPLAWVNSGAIAWSKSAERGLLFPDPIRRTVNFVSFKTGALQVPASRASLEGIPSASGVSGLVRSLSDESGDYVFEELYDLEAKQSRVFRYQARTVAEGARTSVVASAGILGLYDWVPLDRDRIALCREEADLEGRSVGFKFEILELTDQSEAREAQVIFTLPPDTASSDFLVESRGYLASFGNEVLLLLPAGSSPADVGRRSVRHAELIKLQVPARGSRITSPLLRPPSISLQRVVEEPQRPKFYSVPSTYLGPENYKAFYAYQQERGFPAAVVAEQGRAYLLVRRTSTTPGAARWYLHDLVKFQEPDYEASSSIRLRTASPHVTLVLDAKEGQVVVFEKAAISEDPGFTGPYMPVMSILRQSL